MTYEIKAYRSVTSYEKCWLKVDAPTMEEALKLVQENPDEAEYVGGKTIEVIDGDWVDQHEWEITLA